MSHREPGVRRARCVWRGVSSGLVACALLLPGGCTGTSDLEQLRQAMYDQPRYEALERSDFFPDGRASRHPVEGTVARGQLDPSTPLTTGRQGDAFVTDLPVALDMALLERGRERYDIFCSPCHDRAGTGNGIVVKRGMKQPPSFHIERLRSVEPGYIYDVIRNGFGVMYSYGSRIPVADRWAIVAYVRALQLSQHAPLDDVPDGARQQLEQSE